MGFFRPLMAESRHSDSVRIGVSDGSAQPRAEPNRPQKSHNDRQQCGPGPFVVRRLRIAIWLYSSTKPAGRSEPSPKKNFSISPSRNSLAFGSMGERRFSLINIV